MSDSNNTGQLVCVALNDKVHRMAMQQQFNQAPHNNAPTQPVLYFKPRNTFNTSGAAVEWPNDSDEFVVGTSVAVVIGKRCCRVAIDAALDFVEGYTLVSDYSLPETRFYRPDIKGKCLDGSAAIGNKVIKTESLQPLADFSINTSINGQVVEEFPLSNLNQSAEELISIISHIMTLQKGDIIGIGFPAKRLTLQRGDKIESKLGDDLTLTNRVTGEQK